FYTQVRLSDPRRDARGAQPVERGVERGVERVEYRVSRNGAKSAQVFEAQVPQFLRAEFAADPEHGDGRIELHRPVRQPRPAFVVRVPLETADAIEFGGTGVGAAKAAQRFDLRELAIRASQLPLAASARGAMPLAAPLSGDAQASAAKAANSGNRLD